MPAGQTCIYCGRPANDADHVPPKCLSQRPLPNGLIKVPSCKACNRQFGFDDEHFRDSIALSTLDTPDPPELKTLHDAVKRSLLRKPYRPPARKILCMSHQGWTRHGTRIALRATVFPIDMQRIGRTVGRVVKALHYHETKRVLPASHAPKVIHGNRLRSVPFWDRPFIERVFAPLRTAQWRAIGGRAFGYAFASPSRDPDNTIWFLSFLGFE